MIESWYGYAAASDPDEIPYDLSFWRAELSVVGTALSAWLIARRSRAAIPVAVATAAGTTILGKLVESERGSYVRRTWPKKSIRERIFNKAMPILHKVESVALVGAAIASEVKRRREGTSTVPLVPELWWPKARKLTLHYMGFALLGHWGEMAFCAGIKHGIFKGEYDRGNKMLWDQWLFPFPAEGTVAVLANLLLVPVKRAIQDFMNAQSGAGHLSKDLAKPLAIAASFLFNQVICTSIDYATGMVANRNYELWDYRDMRFHFQGQICLQNSLFYSVVATAAVWGLLPLLDEGMARASETSLDGQFVSLSSFFVFLELLYHVIPPKGPATSAE